MADLRTDYKDDVLNINTNERRKYRMINNADGTISFEDVTDYVQNGDSFGSNDVNAITERVNRSLTGADVVDSFESTAINLPFSANKGRELKETFDKKYLNVGVNTEYVQLISTNICKLINNTIFVDVLINITKEIPESGSVLGFDTGDETVTFNSRKDIMIYNPYDLQHTQGRYLSVLAGQQYFIANSNPIPIGSYKVQTIIDLD